MWCKGVSGGEIFCSPVLGLSLLVSLCLWTVNFTSNDILIFSASTPFLPWDDYTELELFLYFHIEGYSIFELVISLLCGQLHFDNTIVG